MAKPAPKSPPKSPAKSPAKAPEKKAAPAPDPVEEEIEEETAEEEEVETEAEETEEEEAEETEAEETETETKADEPLLHDELLDLARAADPEFKVQSSKETDQSYLRRLMTVLSDMPEDEAAAKKAKAKAWFDMLSDAGQDWYNTQLENVEASKEIDAPAGFVSKKVDAPAKGAKGKAKGEKAAKAPKEKKVREPKADGIITISRRVMIQNYDQPRDAVRKLLPDLVNGTFNVQWGWVRACIEEIKSQGHWKD